MNTQQTLKEDIEDEIVFEFMFDKEYRFGERLSYLLIVLGLGCIAINYQNFMSSPELSGIDIVHFILLSGGVWILSLLTGVLIIGPLLFKLKDNKVRVKVKKDLRPFLDSLDYNFKVSYKIREFNEVGKEEYIIQNIKNDSVLLKGSGGGHVEVERWGFFAEDSNLLINGSDSYDIVKNGIEFLKNFLNKNDKLYTKGYKI